MANVFWPLELPFSRVRRRIIGVLGVVIKKRDLRSDLLLLNYCVINKSFGSLGNPSIRINSIFFRVLVFVRSAVVRDHMIHYYPVIMIISKNFVAFSTIVRQTLMNAGDS